MMQASQQIQHKHSTHNLITKGMDGEHNHIINHKSDDRFNIKIPTHMQFNILTTYPKANMFTT
jgi:hypothetical protein